MTRFSLTALQVYLSLLLAAAAAQTPARKAILGTVTEFKIESSELGVKPDNTDVVFVKFGPDTVVAQIPPGERDLKKATPAKVTDIAKGDRVLVSFTADVADARRILVMSATDIAKRNDADRLDWTKRGISGIVTAKSGNQITLKMRSFQGEISATVTAGEKTTYRRYAPDSVKFADAKVSSLAEIGVGDQLRARGEKSEDSLKVTADEVVFGTFLTKAGPITAVNPDAKEVTIQDLVTKKPVVVKLTADSSIKRMPDLAAMFAGGMPGGGMPGGGAPGGGAQPGGSPAGGARPGGMMGGRPFDMSQMLERMPPAKIEDLKAGDTIVVSSTKGVKADEVTAITVLANAGFLIQMASRQTAGGAAAGQGRGQGQGMAGGGMGMGGMGMGGAGGGLGGLDLPGMVP
jgi:hypothetical protein